MIANGYESRMVNVQAHTELDAAAHADVCAYAGELADLLQLLGGVQWYVRTTRHEGNRLAVRLWFQLDARRRTPVIEGDTLAECVHAARADLT